MGTGTALRTEVSASYTVRTVLPELFINTLVHRLQWQLPTLLLCGVR